MSRPRRGPAGTRLRGPAQAAGVAALVGAAYFAIGMAVYGVIDPNASGAAWWPAAGLTLGALVLAPRAWWPLLACHVAA